MPPRPLIRSSRSRNTGSKWIPDELQETLRRFFRRIQGMVVLAVAVIYALTLLSFNANDPSWNTAQTNAVEAANLFGPIGSIVSDIVWQFFGVAAFIPAVVLIAWGWRIFTLGTLDILWGRFVAAFISMLALGVALSTVWIKDVPPGSWNDGGSLASVMAAGLRQYLPNQWGRAVIASVMILLSVTTLYMAFSLTIAEWQALLRTAKSLSQNFTRRLIEMGHKFVLFLKERRPFFSDDIDEEEEEAPAKSVVRLVRRPPPPEPEDEETEEEEDEEGEETSDEEAEEEEAEGEEEEAEDEGEPETERRNRPITARKAKLSVVQRKAQASRQARLAFQDDIYPIPPLELLQWPDSTRRSTPETSREVLEKNAKQLESVLADFGVYGQISKVSPGPVVTLYELEPSPGTRASRVISLADDIARNMSAVSVRVAVVPGRNVIGIELPNKKRETVFLREVLADDAYRDHPGLLPLVLGKDISGAPIISDLARMPHLLIAGTTGSGKSVAINTMILSLIYRLPPQKCRFIMIDPKMLELSVYEGIPHLLAPVVTEPKKAIMALKWTVREMEERYRAMSKLGVRNIGGYNLRLQQAAKNGESLTRTVQTGFDRETGKPIYEEQPLDLTPLPFIVVIVDEMADLMIVAGKDIEGAMQRLAQMARAAGIHIMMATQRPSVDVITGTIKANFPTRISFQVTSKIDSRTILNEQGAEQLLGQGDMLFMEGGGRVTRVHGPFVRDDEVEAIVKFLKAQGEPEYLDEVTEETSDDGGAFGDTGGGGGNSGDEMYDKAVDIVLRERKASISFVQRHLQVGYNKAATIIERMERDGIVGPANHVGKREIYGRKPDEDDE